MVERLFLAVPRGCLQFVIVVFPDHTHLLFLISVMTIVVSLVPPVITPLQRNPQFKPSVWLNSIDIKEGGGGV